MGTTTPLFTILLAALFPLIHAPALSVALGVSLVCDSISAVVIYLILRRYVPSLCAVLGSALFLFNPSLVDVSVSGMETSFYIACSLILTLIALGESATIIGALIGILFLIRPDGLILGGLVLGIRLVARRRLPWKELRSAALVVLPWIVFTTVFYGTPIPQSLSAKMVVYAPVSNPWSSFTILASYPVTMFTFVTSFSPPHSPIGIVPVPICWIVLAVGFGVALRRFDSALVALFPVAYVVTFSIPNRAIFPWYEIPPLPFLLMALVLALFSIESALVRVAFNGFRQSRWGPGRRTKSLGLLTALSLFLLSALSFAEIGQQVPEARREVANREFAYESVATKINAFSHANPVVAGPEVGVLGYYYRGPILDTTALVSPQALPFLPITTSPATHQGYYRVPPALIRRYQPDIIVSLPGYLDPPGPRNDPDFENAYALAPELSDDGGKVLVYVRRNDPKIRLPLTHSSGG